MDNQHHCNRCPYWYVTKKKYPSGFYDITICRKYGKQIYYLAGDKNRTPYPCSICEKEFSYVPYMEQELLQEVEKMAERLSDKNPCTNCKADRQIGNPNRWECECSRCDNPNDWKNECVKRLAEYETAEEDGLLKVLPCKVGDTLFVITPDSPIGIETTKCIRLSIDKRGIKIQAPAVYDDWGNAKWNFKPTDFGKKVFLDFEEAKSFKEMEEDQ